MREQARSAGLPSRHIEDSLQNIAPADLPDQPIAVEYGKTPVWNLVEALHHPAYERWQCGPTRSVISHDADGNALRGDNDYSLHIGPNPPAANFWSITVYDIENRLIIRNEIKRSDRSSRTEGLIKNNDGSVDIYFGPRAPEGKEPNWIQIHKGQSFFVYLRLYGPEQAYFDQTCPMNKIQRVK